MTNEDFELDENDPDLLLGLEAVELMGSDVDAMTAAAVAAEMESAEDKEEAARAVEDVMASKLAAGELSEAELSKVAAAVGDLEGVSATCSEGGWAEGGWVGASIRRGPQAGRAQSVARAPTMLTGNGQVSQAAVAKWAKSKPVPRQLPPWRTGGTARRGSRAGWSIWRQQPAAAYSFQQLHGGCVWRRARCLACIYHCVSEQMRSEAAGRQPCVPASPRVHRLSCGGT